MPNAKQHLSQGRKFWFYFSMITIILPFFIIYKTATSDLQFIYFSIGLIASIFLGNAFMHVGLLLPDIDHPKATIGRMWWARLWRFTTNAEHRGISHKYVSGLFYAFMVSLPCAIPLIWYSEYWFMYYPMFYAFIGAMYGHCNHVWLDNHYSVGPHGKLKRK